MSKPRVTERKFVFRATAADLENFDVLKATIDASHFGSMPSYSNVLRYALASCVASLRPWRNVGNGAPGADVSRKAHARGHSAVAVA